MIHVGNCLDILPTLAAESVHTCVTSPPYFGLRDYGVDGQIGLEPTPDEFVAALVAVFREVRRVLRDDGTVWLNLGDSYTGTGKSGGGAQGKRWDECGMDTTGPKGGKWMPPPAGLKQKDLIGIPWRVAFALQADGWYLRQDIIWHKPNPMPESVRDRCTKAHEYLFLLSKSDRYYFDAAAIAEPMAAASIERLSQPTLEQRAGSYRVPGKMNGPMKAVGSKRNSFARSTKQTAGEHGQKPQHRPDREPVDYGGGTRNKRSVWTVPTMPFKEAHFATFPERLIEPCILAGAPPGGVVLDPFMGAGTTAATAERLGRRWVGCELNPEYAAIARRRIEATHPGLALAVPA